MLTPGNPHCWPSQAMARLRRIQEGRFLGVSKPISEKRRKLPFQSVLGCGGHRIFLAVQFYIDPLRFIGFGRETNIRIGFKLRCFRDYAYGFGALETTHAHTKCRWRGRHGAAGNGFGASGTIHWHGASSLEAPVCRAADWGPNK